MTDLEQDVAKGEKAAYALEYLGTKFDQIEKDIAELLFDVNMHDQASKDELLRSAKNLRKLRGLMVADVENGKLARQLIARSMKDRIRSVVGY